jgi:hypothetical protein
VASPAADDDGPAPQFGVAQQFDRRVERVHVEVGDPAAHAPILAARRRRRPPVGALAAQRGGVGIMNRKGELR